MIDPNANPYEYTPCPPVVPPPSKERLVVYVLDTGDVVGCTACVACAFTAAALHEPWWLRFSLWAGAVLATGFLFWWNRRIEEV